MIKGYEASDINLNMSPRTLVLFSRLAQVRTRTGKEACAAKQKCKMVTFDGRMI